ncbi:membrane protein [Oceanicola sp. 22II-s10i]|uniref:DMT family transporter n=1 Tax=Oceanicola sp. 22II-s10i TaxID=1317116 RepID=UPI000B5241B0|nr:DMT family transporter [Oceanicola sp. 22II-s10i]OWU82322.1 membrane protein [Oceanicola sp. 22II-s10i]
MKALAIKSAALTGMGLVLVYTALMSSADAITKFLAGGYAAPQLYAVSGLLVVAMSLAADRARGPDRRQGMRTGVPRAMALRSVMTVISVTCYFYAFRLLPFAEVFVFIGMVPIFAGLLSGPILREHVRPTAWMALGAGFVGVLCLFPEGLANIQSGHAVALAASLSGTLSMVISRYIGQRESNTLAQVLYPNLTLAVVMACALPFVWKPMPLTDLGWAVAYAGLLFLGRWLLVVALARLAAYVVTPLMNLQFVWMVALGAVVFGETVSLHLILGTAVVIASGIYLVYDRILADREEVQRAPDGKIIAAE